MTAEIIKNILISIPPITLLIKTLGLLFCNALRCIKKVRRLNKKKILLANSKTAKSIPHLVKMTLTAYNTKFAMT
jgi:hypothetical protein